MTFKRGTDWNLCPPHLLGFSLFDQKQRCIKQDPPSSQSPHKLDIENTARNNTPWKASASCDWWLVRVRSSAQNGGQHVWIVWGQIIRYETDGLAEQLKAERNHCVCLSQRKGSSFQRIKWDRVDHLLFVYRRTGREGVWDSETMSEWQVTYKPSLKPSMRAWNSGLLLGMVCSMLPSLVT